MSHSNTHPFPNRLTFATTHASDDIIQLHVVVSPSAHCIAQAICHPVRPIDQSTFDVADVFLPRIQPELHGMFADEMDLLSLTKWRSTCSINYSEARDSFRRSLTKLLNPFVPDPQSLLDIVAEHHGIFGGELALSFMLRDRSYLPQDLEIFASHFDFEGLCDAVTDDPTIAEKIQGHTYIHNTVIRSLRRLVSVTLILHMSGSRIILIHRSYTNSASAPLTRSVCTALSNFVTPYGFGCSHPALTLVRRALLADQEIPHIIPSDHAIINRLLEHRFSMAVSPAAWPEFRRPHHLEGSDDPDVAYTEFTEDGQVINLADDHVVAKECWRDRYVCPSQGRYFGDRGSFVDFFDPLGGDEVHCVDNNITPFGPMAIWRVTSTFDCEEGCDYFDEVLEEGVSSVAVLFKKDPYGELRDDLSDRSMREISQDGRIRVGRQRSQSI